MNTTVQKNSSAFSVASQEAFAPNSKPWALSQEPAWAKSEESSLRELNESAAEAATSDDVKQEPEVPAKEVSPWDLSLSALGGVSQVLKRIQEMSLNEGLKQFGLDPKEWRLQRLARDVYRVEHIRDQGFRFVGRVHGTVLKPLRWKSLTLEAI